MEQPPPLPANKGSVLAGLGMGCLGNLVLLAIPFLVGSSNEKAGLYVLTGIGLLQLTFIVPLFIKYRRIGATNTMVGLIIVASLSLLFCASCGGLLLSFSGKSMH